MTLVRQEVVSILVISMDKNNSRYEGVFVDCEVKELLHDMYVRRTYKKKRVLTRM